MKLFFTILSLTFLYCGSTIYAQSEYLKWKPLVINEKQRIWYDDSSIDTAQSGIFNVWILQMHKPPLEFEEMPGKIYRSKILYAVNLKTGKYGILKVIYYDVNNKEIYNFDYHIENYPDELKYTYPISDNSFMHKLAAQIDKTNNKESN